MSLKRRLIKYNSFSIIAELAQAYCSKRGYVSKSYLPVKYMYVSTLTSNSGKRILCYTHQSNTPNTHQIFRRSVRETERKVSQLLY